MARDNPFPPWVKVIVLFKGLFFLKFDIYINIYLFFCRACIHPLCQTFMGIAIHYHNRDTDIWMSVKPIWDVWRHLLGQFFPAKTNAHVNTFLVKDLLWALKKLHLLPRLLIINYNHWIPCLKDKHFILLLLFFFSSYSTCCTIPKQHAPSATIWG